MPNLTTLAEPRSWTDKYLLSLANDDGVQEVWLISEVGEGGCDAGVKVVPLKAVGVLRWRGSHLEVETSEAASTKSLSWLLVVSGREKINLAQIEKKIRLKNKQKQKMRILRSEGSYDNIF